MDAEEFSRDLGMRLRAARTQNKLSQRQVQEKSSGRWKASMIGNWERGTRNISIESLAGLAEFYGMPAPALIPGNVYIRPRDS